MESRVKVFRPVIGWLAALLVIVLRATCRIRRHNDPRPALRAAGKPYVYSMLHCHQVSALIDGERGTGAMVSRSGDGAIIVPTLLARGIRPIRGSSNTKGADKGGRTAFMEMVAHVRRGLPGYFAADGPRGPRNDIKKGIALLAKETGAAVLLIVPVPTRRWILTGTWDRLQIPQPFSTIDIYFHEPLYAEAGEETEEFRARIELALSTLEQAHDPREAEQARSATERRALARARRSQPAESVTEPTSELEPETSADTIPFRRAG